MMPISLVYLHAIISLRHRLRYGTNFLETDFEEEDMNEE